MYQAGTYRDGVRAALPFMFVVGVFGISYGVLARSAGMGAVAPVVMSLTTFAGSAQFAVASVLSAGGGVAAGIAAAVLLNARYGPLGISAAPAITGPGWWRLLQSQMVVDESWAIGHRGGGLFDRRRLVGAGVGLYVVWAVGTLLGVAAGDVLGDPERLGLDAAFPALFLALLAPQVRRARPLVAATTGAAVALVLVPFTRPGVPVVAACFACLIGWRR